MSTLNGLLNQGLSYLIDPFRNFNFVVEIDGIQAAGYSEVSGLGIELEVERRQFGGDNHTEYKFIKQATYTDLVLKNGISQNDFMWKWFQSTIDGNITPRNGSIYLYDSDAKSQTYWNFFHAYPISWQGPALNAQGNEVATHSMTLAYRQLKKVLV
ncbi:phage tail protein [Pseudoalteromonas sp. S16_S37]|uniref:phage tail protein n=1 Tax=Pseudoalteromonas sp. S16_S37 TaxID=2720228 RepID=UPI0016801184|nr:phage tail protein [Pseudoalteromonas sp. S16_S37]MBD1580874.1 phage tail protein [Pseudoalteromonas sp. S16_S37]